MGNKPRHIPLRTCVICHQTSDKRRLTRLVRQSDGSVIIDPTGKVNGRGAYLCDSAACWEKASRSRELESALKGSLTADERAMIAAHAAKLRGE